MLSRFFKHEEFKVFLHEKGGGEMKKLKVVLWICALSCLLGFVIAAFPWRSLIAMLQWFGVQPPTPLPLIVYALRVFLATFGLIGVFFLILALNPFSTGPCCRLPRTDFCVWAFFCLAGGIWYSMPVHMYAGDVIFCLVAGVLVLVFRKNAINAGSG